VPNDVHLGTGECAARFALLTGPNMAGKSTYIRQTALLALLAHAGSFVPADRARIGVADRICTRVGADDALHAGQSTFMVEMTETAAILSIATERTIVILDEIGRGTGARDGLALAWAVAERLAGAGGAPAPRTLFATHYHELTDLEESLPGRVRNLTVTVREWNDEVVFLHQIAPGRAGHSYGVHVARLAGVPAPVITRAREILRELDAASPPPPQRTPDDQLPLFAAPEHPALAELRELDLESMTPLQAFDALRRLTDRAREA
jgi:DNA mismatch repair protein MutS